MRHVRQSLKDSGIQPSAPRMAIAQFVWHTKSHPTAEDVKHEVEKTFPTVSLATVYNTLNLFVEKGLLKEVKDPNSHRIRYDCNTKPHYHFVDEDSGEMFDLDPRALKISPNHEMLGKNFEIKEIEVILKGRKAK